MSFKYKITINLIACLFIVGCSQKVATRIWEAPSSVNEYPENMEQINQSLNKRPAWKNGSRDFGVVFSGGGTRSAAATLGQLQALNDLGWLDHADYISAVSGGAWGSLPYMFMEESYCGEESAKACDKVYLGGYSPINRITDQELECSDSRSMSAAMADAKFNWRKNNHLYMWLKGKGDETFAGYLGNIFLRPFNLKNKITQELGEQSFFAAGEKEYFDGLLKDQNFFGATAKRSDFFNARVDRPFYIAGGTLMTFGSGDPEYFLPVEMTPYYVGVPSKAKMIKRELKDDEQFVFESSKLITTEIELGGYVEPLAYDFSPPEDRKESPLTRVKVASSLKKQRFTLSDVLAVTGAAPHQTLRSMGPFEILTRNLGFPEHIHWGVKSEEIEDKNTKEYLEHAHGDGGHLDNIGIMPLLARKVDNILVFVNTMTPFSGNNSKGKDKPLIYENITSFFDLKAQEEYSKIFKKKPHNVIFKAEAYSDLLNGLEQQKKKGEPLIYCDKYEIHKNDRYNIKEDDNYKPNICWVYLNRSEKWLAQIKNNTAINSDVKKDILEKKGEFKHFPHYWTFFNDLPKITVINKSHKQVNLLANLTAWSVRSGVDIIRSGFDADLAKTLNQEVNSKLAVDVKLDSCDKPYEFRARELLVGDEL